MHLATFCTWHLETHKRVSITLSLFETEHCWQVSHLCPHLLTAFCWCHELVIYPVYCRLCFCRQRLRESTLTENPVWSPVGRLAVMAGSWQLLQLMKYSDYSTMCFSWFPSEAERRVMMLGQLMALYFMPRLRQCQPQSRGAMSAWWRWQVQDGTGAASHKLASTRLEPSGRLSRTWGNRVTRQLLWMTEQPCSGSALLPPLWGRA